jgi:sterol desaturase/sphingolipid hydroxylase (fatty acid hydroxylase superfamily)
VRRRDDAARFGWRG